MMHKYILKTQAVAICTHCERALDTPDVLHRINAHDDLLDAAEWILRNAGYEKGEAADNLSHLNVSRFRLDELLNAVRIARGTTEAKEKYDE